MYRERGEGKREGRKKGRRQRGRGRGRKAKCGSQERRKFWPETTDLQTSKGDITAVS